MLVFNDPLWDPGAVLPHFNILKDLKPVDR